MINKEKKDILINFRVSQSQKDMIEALCALKDENQTQLIMRLIKQELKNI
jgi:uncharacterized protein (DUF1778 family)